LFCDRPRKLNLSLALHCLGRGLSSSSTLGYSWPTRSTALSRRPPFDDSETQTSDLAIVHSNDEEDYHHHYSKTANQPAVTQRFKPPFDNTAISSTTTTTTQHRSLPTSLSEELLATGAHSLAASRGHGQQSQHPDTDNHFCARNSVCQVEPNPVARILKSGIVPFASKLLFLFLHSSLLPFLIQHSSLLIHDSVFHSCFKIHKSYTP